MADEPMEFYKAGAPSGPITGGAAEQQQIYLSSYQVRTSSLLITVIPAQKELIIV